MTEEEQIDRLKNLVADLLEEAKKQGADAAEADVSTQTGLSVTVRLGETETIEHTSDNGLGITVYFGQRKGSASTTDLRPDAVRESVAAACRIARYTSEDPAAGLADPDLLATDVPDLDLFHPWELDADAAAEIARGCEDAARSVDPRISNSEGATLYTQRSSFIYGNIARLRRRLPHHAAQPELRGDRPARRRHAARLLVRQQPGRRRVGRPGRDRPTCRRAHAGATRQPQAQHPRVPGTVSLRYRAQPAAQPVRRDPWTCRVPQIDLPARPGRASRSFPTGSTSAKTRCGRAARPARPSTTRALRPGTVNWSRAACCRATCWTAMPLASSVCRAPPAPAACATRASPAAASRSMNC